MGPFYCGDSRSVVLGKRIGSLIPARSGFLGESEFVFGNAGPGGLREELQQRRSPGCRRSSVVKWSAARTAQCSLCITEGSNILMVSPGLVDFSGSAADCP
jgi:hypothetical protein